jgi:hypothetical protein
MALRGEGRGDPEILLCIPVPAQIAQDLPATDPGRDALPVLLDQAVVDRQRLVRLPVPGMGTGEPEQRPPSLGFRKVAPREERAEDLPCLKPLPCEE